MGEAKRRKIHGTLDGGPPSDAKIAMVVDVFDPLEALLAMNDKPRLTTIRELAIRSYRHPTPICAACDHEFALGEPAPLAYCIRPFIPKADEHVIIAGGFCSRCASLPRDRMMQQFMRYLRQAMPGRVFNVVEGGSA
jgi:hypothetical protein